jgi:tetratricopeptide (TPR) repeat protein
MPIVLLVVALALIAFAVSRTMLKAGPKQLDVTAAELIAASEALAVEHAPGTEDPMTIAERVETGSIIDDWIDVVRAPTVEAKRAGEMAIIERCDRMLATLDDREGIADVDTATSALRSVLAMALSYNAQYRNCVEVLREQPVPASLLEPSQRSVHPLPLLARSLARLGEYDEALSVLDADEALDDRRDPGSAVIAAAERDRQRAMVAFNRGDFGAARTTVAAEADEETTHGNDLHRVTMLATLAQIDQEAGALDRAWEEATEAVASFAGLESRAGDADAASVDVILARIELARGDAASARDRAARARTALTPHRPEGWSEATVTLAAAERHLGLLDDALSHAAEALDIVTDLETKHAIALAEREVGEIHLARGEHEAAVAHLERACTLFEEMGCTPRAAEVRALLDSVAP